MKRITFLVASALAASAIPASPPAWADDWHGVTNYPAQVSAFTFGSGVLSANHPVHFGAWTVSFGAQSVQTVYVQQTAGYSWFHTGKPYSLICANAVLGQTTCAMWLQPASQNSVEACKMALLPNLGTVDLLPIPCPTSITFQR
jgi:hypothetical protein